MRRVRRRRKRSIADSRGAAKGGGKVPWGIATTWEEGGEGRGVGGIGEGEGGRGGLPFFFCSLLGVPGETKGFAGERKNNGTIELYP